ncbi:MAG TPA: phosphoribosylaminoimidazolesuccinocarboxamide synthase [Candidatus Dormibacteraeota bacterium]|nr:phosphoribosylaminoimidazolesuccinocarboxamide synthase [Candidatus Dormibacteraeota bacterium]
MNDHQALTQTHLELPLFSRGKVRDTYHLDDRRLLMVSTDRISAFDYVLPTAIPDRGRVLTQLSAFWFDKTRDVVPNHLLATSYDGLTPDVEGRCMVVKRAERIDFECVVRGYLAGSAWAEYRRSGTVAGEPLPEGLRESEKLPEPVFTPATKADAGHDENITFDRVRSEVGGELADRLKDASLRLYDVAARHAGQQGLILADTKFEFGLIDGELVLIDEALTPDSSRYWDAEAYEVGTSPESFDKQFVRDWLTNRSGWDRDSLPPPLPDDVVEQTRQRYLTAFERLTGRSLFSNGNGR